MPLSHRTAWTPQGVADFMCRGLYGLDTAGVAVPLYAGRQPEDIVQDSQEDKHEGVIRGRRTQPCH